MSYDLVHADVLEWAAGYTGPKFHAMLLDPPYHLTSIVKRFGKNGAAPAKGDVYNRASRGFMGQDWDGGDLIFRPETWAAFAQHLYPGGFGMAFASSRGWHRMAVAIEDAGLIIHPSVFMLGWCYLSGFPKATRVDTQVDKAAGLNGQMIAETASRSRVMDFGMTQGGAARYDAQSPLAQQWAGHRYGLQALKPALEPIIVFQHPYEGRPVDSIVATGAGALWVDGSRIPAENKTPFPVGTQKTGYNGSFPTNGDDPNPNGRWPANLTLTHTPACRPDACAADCPVRGFDEQAGESVSKMSERGAINIGQMAGLAGESGNGRGYSTERGHNDSGPASRIFHRSDWSYEVAEQLASAGPVRYEPKASSAEREVGLDALETQTRHRMRPDADPSKLTGLNNEPRFAPVQAKNHHPTVKPIALTKYLATLLLPPAAYAPRRLLVPFAGVGSEMIGATLAGWEEVTGIEKTAAYLPIARARLDWWSQWPGWGQTDVDKILAAKESDAPLFTQKELL